MVSAFYFIGSSVGDFLRDNFDSNSGDVGLIYMIIVVPNIVVTLFGAEVLFAFGVYKTAVAFLVLGGVSYGLPLKTKWWVMVASLVGIGASFGVPSNSMLAQQADLVFDSDPISGEGASSDNMHPRQRVKTGKIFVLSQCLKTGGIFLSAVLGGGLVDVWGFQGVCYLFAGAQILFAICLVPLMKW